LELSGDNVACHLQAIVEQMAAGIQQVVPKDAIQHPTMHRVDSHNEELFSSKCQ
jgi:hypothetical protein